MRVRNRYFFIFFDKHTRGLHVTSGWLSFSAIAFFRAESFALAAAVRSVNDTALLKVIMPKCKPAERHFYENLLYAR